MLRPAGAPAFNIWSLVWLVPLLLGMATLAWMPTFGGAFLPIALPWWFAVGFCSPSKNLYRLAILLLIVVSGVWASEWALQKKIDDGWLDHGPRDSLLAGSIAFLINNVVGTLSSYVPGVWLRSVLRKRRAGQSQSAGNDEVVAKALLETDESELAELLARKRRGR